MSEIVRNFKPIVKALTPEQIDHFKGLNADAEEFFKRGRAAQTQANKELQEIAGPKNDFEFSEDGSYLLIYKRAAGGTSTEHL